MTEFSEEQETEQDDSVQAGMHEGVKMADEGVGTVSPAGEDVTEEEGKLLCSREELVRDQARDPGLQDMFVKALAVEEAG